MKSANILIDRLTNCEGREVIYAAPKQKLEFENDGKSYVYLILNGVVDVRRKTDGIIVLTEKSPCVLGLTSIFSGNYYHYITTVTDSHIVAIQNKNVVDFLKREMLWEEVAEILCKAAQYYYEKDEATSGANVYILIKKHLELLWTYPEEERRNISIFNFIMQRNNISRSSLNKVLKDLSSGGYTKIKRGKLLDLKKLPNKY